MKIFFVLLFVAVAYSTNVEPRISCKKTDDHDLVINCDTLGTLMHNEVVEQSADPFVAHRKTITYPQQGQADNPIGCIRVKDLVGNDQGGCPQIVSGGYGFMTVTIEIISQVGGDIHNSIEIYQK